MCSCAKSLCGPRMQRRPVRLGVHDGVLTLSPWHGVMPVGLLATLTDGLASPGPQKPGPFARLSAESQHAPDVHSSSTNRLAQGSLFHLLSPAASGTLEPFLTSPKQPWKNPPPPNPPACAVIPDKLLKIFRPFFCRALGNCAWGPYALNSWVRVSYCYVPRLDSCAVPYCTK